MTADPLRRRRNTRLGALSAAVLIVVAAVAVVVGVSTLRTSEAGSAPPEDTRVEVAFPSTPTLALAVVDDEQRLASLVIGVLSPTGVGGSLVSVPVNVDTTIGFGETRSPLSSSPYTPGDAASIEALTMGLESFLAITVQHALIVGPDELAELFADVEPIDVVLSEAVFDSDRADDGEVVGEGEVTLDVDGLVEVLTAIDIDGSSYSHHDVDVAVWGAFAEAASSMLSVDVAIDSGGVVVDPIDSHEVFDRLLSGDIAHRDLLIDTETPATIENPDGADFVLVDRSDVALVFAEIAPGLMSTPNESLSFQIIARFTDEQVATVGEDVTTVTLMHDLIGELLFAQGNIVSVQTAASIEGPSEVTRLEVADKLFVDAVTSVAPVLFGEVDVVVSTRVIEGVDVVAVLGTGFLDRRVEIAAEAAGATSESAAVEVADATDGESAGESADETTSESTGEPTGESADVEATDATSDTVAADE